MRFLSGLVLGCLLTIGAAYVHDAAQPQAAVAVADTNPGEGRMVNWTVVDHQIRGLSGWVQGQWAWISNRLNRTG